MIRLESSVDPATSNRESAAGDKVVGFASAGLTMNNRKKAVGGTK